MPGVEPARFPQGRVRQTGHQPGLQPRAPSCPHRRAHPHAQDGEDHPQVRPPLPQAGAVGAPAANHALHPEGGADHHARLPVGREGLAGRARGQVSGLAASGVGG